MQTRTGSGKSLTYESIPVLISNTSVLVVAPLLTIMEEQCSMRVVKNIDVFNVTEIDWTRATPLASNENRWRSAHFKLHDPPRVREGRDGLIELLACEDDTQYCFPPITQHCVDVHFVTAHSV